MSKLHSFPLWLLPLVCIVSTVAAVAVILVLLVLADPTLEHALVLDLAQLVLRLIELGLVRIVLLPQLFVPRNLLLQLLTLVLYLLLKTLILLIKFGQTVLQVTVLRLHHI